MKNVTRILLAATCCVLESGASAAIVATGDVTAPFLQIFPPPEDIDFPEIAFASMEQKVRYGSYEDPYSRSIAARVCRAVK